MQLIVSSESFNREKYQIQQENCEKIKDFNF